MNNVTTNSRSLDLRRSPSVPSHVQTVVRVFVTIGLLMPLGVLNQSADLTAQAPVSETHGDWTLHYDRDVIRDTRSNVFLTTTPLTAASSPAPELAIFCTDGPLWDAPVGGPQLALVYPQLWGEEVESAQVTLRFDDSSPLASASWARRAPITRARIREMEASVKEAARTTPEIARMMQSVLQMARTSATTQYAPGNSSELITGARRGNRLALEIDAGPAYLAQYVFSLRGLTAGLSAAGSYCGQ